MAKQEVLPDVFHFEDASSSFESLGHSNGERHWYARQLMKFLGYGNYSTFFRGAINKAISTCSSLGISIPENFEQVTITDDDGREVEDFKLTRFACYLVSMNGDNRKHNVAAAQAYFAAIAATFASYIEASENVDRVSIRDDVSIHEKSLGSTAQSHGVEVFQYFQNAGYRGLYNMNLRDLKSYKRFAATSRSLLDFMGKEELAANLFRITQTESKIEKENVRGQKNLERTAENVGKMVRKTIAEIGGTMPEDLELTEDIRKVKKKLKLTHKNLKKLDQI